MAVNPENLEALREKLRGETVEDLRNVLRILFWEASEETDIVDLLKVIVGVINEKEPMNIDTTASWESFKRRLKEEGVDMYSSDEE